MALPNTGCSAQEVGSFERGQWWGEKWALEAGWGGVGVPQVAPDWLNLLAGWLYDLAGLSVPSSQPVVAL